MRDIVGAEMKLHIKRTLRRQARVDDATFGECAEHCAARSTGDSQPVWQRCHRTQLSRLAERQLAALHLLPVHIATVPHVRNAGWTRSRVAVRVG
jgi:hypothetical protein